MRRLVWLTAGYTAALALGHYLLPSAWLPWCALGMGLLALAALGLKGVRRRAALALGHYLLPSAWLPWCALGMGLLALAALGLKGVRRRAALLLCLAAAVGFGWMWGHGRLVIDPADALTDSEQSVRAVALDYAERYEGYERLTIRLREPGLPRCKVTVYDYDGTLRELRPGDELALTLRFLSARERSGESTDSYLASGVYVRAGLEGEAKLTGRSAWGWLLSPRTLAKALKERIAATFPADVAGFMRALLTGDKSALYGDAAVYGALRRAGLSHVMAVSGLHVSFLVGAVRLFTGRRRRTAFLCLPLLAVYMAMTGFTPSVARSGVMLGMGLIAPLLRREYDAPTALAAPLLLLLALNPEAIASVSLQLSFAAMAGITLLSPRLYGWLAGTGNASRWRRGLASGLAASLGAVVFTAPLTALHFGFVALYAPLSNLLCLWAVSVAFLAGYAVCLAGAICSPLGLFLGKLAAFLPRYIFLIARLVGKLPLAALYTRDNYIAWWIAFVYAVFLLAWLTKGWGRMRPVLPVCACISLLVAVSFLRLGGLAAGEMTVAAVDVGQGESVVVLQPGSAVVIDCGGMSIGDSAGERAAAYLAENGKRAVELLVLTHLHADHVNGVAYLMELTQVRRLALPEDAAEDTGYREQILALAERKGTEVYTVTENMRLTLGDLELTLFAPLGGEAVNERGLIVLGECAGARFLVTGDADADTETILTSLYELPPVDLLVVGHHGSRSSTSTALLDEIQPQYAFISVGYNSYGHPHETVLQRLEQYGVRVFRTDMDGTVSMTVGRDDG